MRNEGAGHSPGQAPTTYGYDPVGNLASVTYPNGVTTTYSYNLLNRLTRVAATTASNALASYTYTLGAAGNRTGATELSGRRVTYGYDDIYRLTSETITGAAQQNGTIGYVYDSVGNRKTLTSTVAAIPAGVMNYDINDRISTDVSDNNGNNLGAGGTENVYDFENHLVRKGDITIIYDGDGNRVSKTKGVLTTNYVVDTNNPTGYAQVLEEIQDAHVVRTYSYGLDLNSQTQKLEDGSWQLSFYGYDGHGSVRYLTNAEGNVTDTYDYDAFGNLIASTGTTANNYLYAGEQFDPNLGLYYNRARYLDVRTGRFWGMDQYEGSQFQPASLHPYLYAGGDPVTHIDKSGHESLADISISLSVGQTLDSQNSKVQLAAREAIEHARVFDIYACSRFQAFVVPFHCFLYANLPGNEGLRYDVGANRIGVDVLKGPVSGFLQVQNTTLEAARIEANFSFKKVASLTFPSFLKWQAFVVADATFIQLIQDEGTDIFQFSLPYNLYNGVIGEGLNCFGFTGAAVAEAKILERSQ